MCLVMEESVVEGVILNFVCGWIDVVCDGVCVLKMGVVYSGC